MPVQPSSVPPEEGIFPLELTWVLTPFPKNSLERESINRDLVCAPMHSVAQTHRSCPRWVNPGNKKIPSMHHPQGRNMTTSMVGLENGPIHKNLTKNGEPQRYSWECRRRRLSKMLNYRSSKLANDVCPSVNRKRSS